MIPAGLQPLADHLWQSTLFVAVAALLALVLRKNRAAVRYWLWLAASVKFLVPFSLLTEAGSRIPWQPHPAVSQPQISFAMEQIARPFVMPAPVSVNTSTTGALPVVPAILFCLWFCGFALAAASWIRSWRRVRAVRRAASPLDLKLPVPVFSTSAQMEPGVFGIRKPVLLLPAGIADRLTPAQLEAVLAHELCHVRRRDNLTAAVHTLVETVFWFHPLVWWIRARLVEERERACDEAVVESAGDAQAYAEGILNVCRFYLESPLAGVSGVAGSNLRRRIESVLNWCAPRELSLWKKILLGVAGFAAVAGPLAVGAATAASASAQPRPAAATLHSENLPADQRADIEAPAQTTGSSGPKFKVASVSRSSAEIWEARRTTTPDSVKYTRVPLSSIVQEAHEVDFFHIVGTEKLGGQSARYDIAANLPDGANVRQIPGMLRQLLADRFHLAAHRETRESQAYVLTVTKGGLKLKPVPATARKEEPDDTPGSRLLLTPWGQVHLNGAMTLATFVARLSPTVNRAMGGPLIDRTGAEGEFEILLDAMVPGADSGYPRPAPGSDVEYAANRLLSKMGHPDILTDPPDLSSALKEMGLEIERQILPIEYLVIDQVSLEPTEN